MGWADVATKQDLANLEERIELRFSRVDERFNAIDDRITAATSDLRATIEHELRAQATIFGHELRSQTTTTTMVFGLVSVVVTMAALAFALVRFT